MAQQVKNGAAALLRWWPIVIFCFGIVGLVIATYIAEQAQLATLRAEVIVLRAEIVQAKTERLGQIAELKVLLAEHKVQGESTQLEEMRRIANIEVDLKELLRRK